ncbi:cytochrome P450 [Mycolicibacterium novocastrense]|uniref:cytochrome P450 n=1 Tax=Mycolicibacterium novocastrense TaxID=59813 RepID=UPI000A9EF4CD|nr:cytochrome P450 [Mycolicibacterium novocastrense]
MAHGVPYNPMSPEQADNPFPWLKVARETAPVFYLAEHNVYCVTRYHDMLEVIKDTETFSSQNAVVGRDLEGELAEIFPDGIPQKHSILVKDQPEHTAKRRLLQKYFTQASIAQREGQVRKRAVELIEDFRADGKCELVSQYTAQLPLLVICDIVGLPQEQAAEVNQWSDDVMLLVKGAPKLSEEEEAALAARTRPFQKWLLSFVEERIHNPQDDLTSELLRARNDDGALAFTHDGVIGAISSLLTAGVGTTKNFLALATRELLKHREQWEEIQADRSLLGNAIEECLRTRMPGRGTRRLAMRDSEIAGVKIPAGSTVQLLLHSPARDEAVFEDGDTFDIHRPNAKQHFAFGRGTHFCLGAHLARLETRITFEEFLDRLPGLRLVEGQQYQWVPNMTIPEFRTLYLEW